MEDLGWILWTLLGIIFIVAEVFTLGFFILWFGVGALLAAVAAALGFGVVTQFFVFIIASIVLTALSRTIFSDKFINHQDKIKSGAEGLIGKKTVLLADENREGQLAVKVFGSTWTVLPFNDEHLLNEGEKVEIVAVEGATLRVKKISVELPDWRGSD